MSMGVSVHSPLLQKTKLNLGAHRVLAEVCLAISTLSCLCHPGMTKAGNQALLLAQGWAGMPSQVPSHHSPYCHFSLSHHPL